MSQMYLAKINLNSNIFEVYDKELSISEVSDIIFDKIPNVFYFEDKNKKTYTDSNGNIIESKNTSIYRFSDIDKTHEDGKIITGRVWRTFFKPSEYEDQGDVKTKFVQEQVNINFYYDVENELVAFRERQSFGYNQFMDAFKEMLNSCVSEYQFEVFLKKDYDTLNSKLKSLGKVVSIKAELIPPNSNEEDLEALRNHYSYLNDCKESNTKKMVMMCQSDSINLDAKLMKEIVNATSLGYGQLTATGYDDNNQKKTINSNQDAPVKVEMSDKDDFIETAKKFIKSVVKKYLL